jgi:hypothetical protein
VFEVMLWEACWPSEVGAESSESCFGQPAGQLGGERSRKVKPQAAEAGSARPRDGPTQANGARGAVRDPAAGAAKGVAPELPHTWRPPGPSTPPPASTSSTFHSSPTSRIAMGVPNADDEETGQGLLAAYAERVSAPAASSTPARACGLPPAAAGQPPRSPLRPCCCTPRWPCRRAPARPQPARMILVTIPPLPPRHHSTFPRLVTARRSQPATGRTCPRTGPSP